MKVLLLTIAFAFTAAAQKQPTKPCSLSLDHSPEVRGLKLGQTFDSLKGVGDTLGYSSPDDKAIGLLKVFVSPIMAPNSEVLRGVREISLVYLDNELASFQVDYKRDVEWESDAHFASAIAEQLKLPNQGWEPGTLYLHLQCDGFFVEAGRSRSGGTLRVVRSSLENETEKRNTQHQQKKRVEFKP